MAQLDLEVETSLAPEQVIDALTDFSERRTKLFPALAPEYFEVYSRTETSAEVMEGTAKPKIWARERYDWSTPGTVSWEVVDSNYFKSGTVVTMRPESTGSGSTVHIHWEREPKTIKARALVTLMSSGGGRFMNRYYNDMFRDLEKVMSIPGEGPVSRS